MYVSPCWCTGFFDANFYIKMTGCVERKIENVISGKILEKHQKKEEAMHCLNCGNEINEGNTFCIKCGEKLNKVDWANKKWITINKPKRRSKKNFIIIASLIVYLCIVYVVSFKEKILIHYAEEHLKYYEYDEVRNLLKYFITDNVNMTQEEETLHALYYYATICSDIENTARNIETANSEDFVIRYENNKARLEQYEDFLPEQYREVWYDINLQYYYTKYGDFQREYCDIVENEIIGEITDKLYKIIQSEETYSFSELNEMVEEKKALLSKIKQSNEEQKNRIKKYYSDYSGSSFLQALIEDADEIIGTLEGMLESKGESVEMELNIEIDAIKRRIDKYKYKVEVEYDMAFFGPQDLVKEQSQFYKEFILALKFVLDQSIL